MTFQQLSFVVEVANCESINKAAERLYNVPEQCQQQHQGLGGRIGNPDLPSNQKGVSVTEEGREFLSYANEIIDKKFL